MRRLSEAELEQVTDDYKRGLRNVGIPIDELIAGTMVAVPKAEAERSRNANGSNEFAPIRLTDGGGESTP